MAGWTYPEVGATRDGPLPGGYRHLRVRSPLSRGDARGDLRAAGEVLLSWRMHRAIGLGFETSAVRAEPGARVTTRIGAGSLSLSAPCQVVWTVDEADRAGFGYGTLAGHPFAGEEAFVVDRDPDGTLWFTVTSFSRPLRWYTRAAGRLVVPLQRAYALRCAATLRRLCRPR